MEQEPDVFTESDYYIQTRNFAIVFLFFYCIFLPFGLFMLLKRRYESIYDKPGLRFPAMFTF